MGLPLALYYLTQGVQPEKPASAAPVPASVQRPDGLLVWLHAPRPEDHPIVRDLQARLSARNPDLQFLVTSDHAMDADWPKNCIRQPVPEDTRPAVTRFVENWRPDVAAWLGGDLRPGLIAAAASAQVPIYMLDTGDAHAATIFQSRIPGLRRSIIRQFEMILAGDHATAAAFRRAGAKAAQIRTTGVLERGVETLHCLEAERDTLAYLFAARPIWLAAEIHRDEYDPVLTAHAAALRRTHRLLLILVPSDAADGAALAKMLTERDMSFEMRSTGAEPEAETQVYVADTEGEMGLWYRLAPTSFLGHSLVKGDGHGPHPFNAAALGSVVLHGPQTDDHRDAYLRLQRANASRQIADAGELAAAIDTLLAPDKAAEMAHAAWQVCSAGAEVTDLVLDLLSQALAKRKVSG
ncbi:MAG: glycosyltransferase N-terminal domain-containing protein [Paracoccaceae bacterium]